MASVHRRAAGVDLGRKEEAGFDLGGGDGFILNTLPKSYWFPRGGP